MCMCWCVTVLLYRVSGLPALVLGSQVYITTITQTFFFNDREKNPISGLLAWRVHLEGIKTILLNIITDVSNERAGRGVLF